MASPMRTALPTALAALLCLIVPRTYIAAQSADTPGQSSYFPETQNFVRLTCDTAHGTAAIRTGSLDYFVNTAQMAQIGLYETGYAFRTGLFPLKCDLGQGQHVSVTQNWGDWTPLEVMVNGVYVSSVSYSGNHAVSIDETYFVVTLGMTGIGGSPVVRLDEQSSRTSGDCRVYRIEGDEVSREEAHECAGLPDLPSLR